MTNEQPFEITDISTDAIGTFLKDKILLDAGHKSFRYGG